MNESIKYLVRKLIIINNEGKESCFPLVIITAIKVGDILVGFHMSPFEAESAGTLYLNELQIKQVSSSSFRIKLLRL